MKPIYVIKAACPKDGSDLRRIFKIASPLSDNLHLTYYLCDECGLEFESPLLIPWILKSEKAEDNLCELHNQLLRGENEFG